MVRKSLFFVGCGGMADLAAEIVVEVRAYNFPKNHTMLIGNAAGVTRFGWPARRRAASLAIPQHQNSLVPRAVQSPPVASYTSIFEKEEAAAADLAEDEEEELAEHDEPAIYVDMAITKQFHTEGILSLQGKKEEVEVQAHNFDDTFGIIEQKKARAEAEEEVDTNSISDVESDFYDEGNKAEHDHADYGEASEYDCKQSNEDRYNSGEEQDEAEERRAAAAGTTELVTTGIPVLAANAESRTPPTSQEEAVGD